MRFLRKNMTKLKYALYAEKMPVYELDEYGLVVYDEIDGEEVPRIIDTISGYHEPEEFIGTLSFSGGESEAAVYGVSTADYDCKLVMPKDSIPITETSLIFQSSEPQYDSKGNLKRNSADFTVVKVAPYVQSTVYLLKRIIHNA